jgi:LacI family transcriptional regulator
VRYRPNAAAQALSKGKMNAIGVAAVLEGGMLNHYFLEILNGIVEAAVRHDHHITVFTMHDWEKEASRVETFCDGRVDGLILAAPMIAEVTPEHFPGHVPFVSLHANHPLPGVLNIQPDEFAGSATMVKELIRLCHKRILYVAGPAHMEGARRRLEGYRHAMSEEGLGGEPDLVVEGGFSSINGKEAIKKWLETHRGESLPTAIVCANDASAIGCQEALAEAGILVPDDISIAGFDDTLASRMTVPPLSTVRQPIAAMAAKAVDLLLDPAARETVPPEGLIFPTEILLRGSVAKPRKHKVVAGQ